MRALLLVLGIALAGLVQAQPYPSKPVHFVTPFAPGGPTDIVARITGQKMSELLGQPVIVESRAGAGGNIGTAFVAKSAPDGYTVLVTSSAFAVNVTLSPNAGFDAEHDLIPTAVPARQPNLLFVHPSLPVKTLTELVAYARNAKLAFASPGSGTTPHLTGEYFFNQLSGLGMPAVHFRGAGPAITAVVGGEPPVGVGAISTPLPHVKGGRLRALAVSSAARVQALPEVPTFAEAGYPGIEDYTWIGAFLPAGTPPAIVQRLNEAFNQSLRAPEVSEKLTGLAYDLVGGSPKEFSNYVKAEIVKWGKVVKAGDIKAE